MVSAVKLFLPVIEQLNFNVKHLSNRVLKCEERIEEHVANLSALHDILVDVQTQATDGQAHGVPASVKKIPGTVHTFLKHDILEKSRGAVRKDDPALPLCEVSLSAEVPVEDQAKEALQQSGEAGEMQTVRLSIANTGDETQTSHVPSSSSTRAFDTQELLREAAEASTDSIQDIESQIREAIACLQASLLVEAAGASSSLKSPGSIPGRTPVGKVTGMSRGSLPPEAPTCGAPSNPVVASDSSVTSCRLSPVPEYECASTARSSIDSSSVGESPEVLPFDRRAASSDHESRPPRSYNAPTTDGWGRFADFPVPRFAIGAVMKGARSMIHS